MESTPAKPLKNRRRWLIIALLLVLASGLAWWEWPRGDVRLVGRWALHGDNEEILPDSEWEFTGNGWVVLHRPAGKRKGAYSVSDNILRLGGVSRDSSVATPVAALADWMSEMTGARWIIFADEFEMTIAGETLELVPVPRRYTIFRFTRIPE